MSRTYFEDFLDSPGGWIGWASNAAGPAALERGTSSIITRSPWWVDYNHAPPGAGYLHVLLALQTRPHFALDQPMQRLAGLNRFVAETHPTDFRNATLSLRLRGDVNLRGARFAFHVQAKLASHFVNYTLTGRPFSISSEWSEQTVELTPDSAIWTCLGSKHDRTDFYGVADLESVLRDVNNNVIFILFPLDIAAAGSRRADLHRLRAGEEYDVDRIRLPSGYLEVDWVRLEFAHGPK